ncbi:MAG: hypothetical protein RL329_3483, partial [Bacteroidota bacterium]
SDFGGNMDFLVRWQHILVVCGKTNRIVAIFKMDGVLFDKTINFAASIH